MLHVLEIWGCLHEAGILLSVFRSALDIVCTVATHHGGDARRLERREDQLFLLGTRSDAESQERTPQMIIRRHTECSGSISGAVAS